MTETQFDYLSGPKLKIGRAKHHVDDIEATLKVFFEAKPYELAAEVDAMTGEEVWRVRIHKCLPRDLSTIVGDVAHNLRSALDQMVCGLVRANRRQVSGGNGFPISGTPHGFTQAKVGKLKNVSPRTNRFIGRLKPYRGGNKALWLLSELNNMDKHNSIIPVAVGQAQIQVRWGIPGMFFSADGAMFLGGGPPGSTPFPPGWDFLTPDDSRLVALTHDNVEIYRRSPKLAGVPYETRLPIEIAFGKTAVTNYEPIVGTLRQLIELVERIVDIAERRILERCC